jgi:hypothetical protein
MQAHVSDSITVARRILDGKSAVFIALFGSSARLG